jgi:hypothetical protein
MEGIRYASLEVKSRRFFVRLMPGTDLIPGIKALCAKHNIKAGAISTMLGSLRQVRFVWPIPDSVNKCGLKYGAPKTLEGPIELVSGTGVIGTMKDSGELAVHLHASFSDSTSKMWGGHIVDEGNPVAVTIEVVIDAYDDLSLARNVDDETGMPLFNIVGQPVVHVDGKA